MPESNPSPSPRTASPWWRWGQWLLLSAAFAAVGCFLLARFRAEMQKPGLTPVLFAAVLGGGIGYAATVNRIGSRPAVVILAALLGAGSAAGMTMLRHDAWRDALREEYLGDLPPPLEQFRPERERKFRRISGFEDYLSHRLADFDDWPWAQRRPEFFFGTEIALAGLVAAGAALLIHVPRRNSAK